DALRALAPMALKPTTAAVTSSGSPAREDAATMVVVGGAEGSGATEVSIAIACAISTRVRPLVLLDADASGPSIAMRLAITSERNIRTAIDAVEHGLGELDDALTTVGGVRVLAGLPNVSCWDQVRSGEMRRLLDRVRSSVPVVVADVGGALERLEVDGSGRFEIARSTVATASELVAIVAPSPIGVMRGVRWITAARELAPEAGVHVVVNRAPVDPFIRGEITDALVRAVDPRGVNILPDDRRVERAAWDGTHVEPGPFVRGAAEPAEPLVAGSRPARARRSGRSVTVAAGSQ